MDINIISVEQSKLNCAILALDYVKNGDDVNPWDIYIVKKIKSTLENLSHWDEVMTCDIH